MCHFITLVASADQENEVAEALDAQGRVARKISNPSLAKVSPQGSVQFLTTYTCDCGTTLGRRLSSPLEMISAHENEVRRLRKKGWSDSKIERSLSDKEAALATSTARRPTDSFELWSNVISDLASHRNAKPIGLFVHDYRAGIEDEPLEPKVRRATADASISDTLRTLLEDELVLFT